MRIPTVVLDLDLNAALPSLPDDVTDVRILWRLNGRPITFTRPRLQPETSPRELVRDLLDTGAWAFAVPMAERAIAAGVPPRWIDVEGFLQSNPQRPAIGPRVSVIVRAPADHDPAECVASLRDQDYANVEIVESPASEPVRAAMSRATGHVVALLDGRTIVDRGWASAVVRVFMADPEVMAVSSLVIPRELTGTLRDQFDARAFRAGALQRTWSRRRMPGCGLEALPLNVAWWRTALDGLPARQTIVFEPAALIWSDAAWSDTWNDPVRGEAGMCLGLDGSGPSDPGHGHGREREVVVDLANHLAPIAAGGDVVTLDVRWRGEPLGLVRIPHQGAIVSVQWQSDAIVAALAGEILDAGLHFGTRVVEAALVSGLARHFAGRPECAAVPGGVRSDVAA